MKVKIKITGTPDYELDKEDIDFAKENLEEFKKFLGGELEMNIEHIELEVIDDV